MALRVDLDNATAASVADYLAATGRTSTAAHMWQGLCWAAPYDRGPRERAGDLLFDAEQAAYPVGSVARSRFLLTVISLSYPTLKLTRAYFGNLETYLQNRPKRERPGDVVVAATAGRCGSTTLAAAIASADDVCATHENPPGVSWRPEADQVQFHLKRLHLLADYYALVFDASHWWINLLDPLFSEFPASKVIGLQRETESCVRSFLAVKGSGQGSTNHWAHPNNGVWGASLGDPYYPSYPIPDHLAGDPDAAKSAMIRSYITDYKAALAQLAARLGERMLMLRTEELGEPTTATRLSAFLNRAITMPERSLNAGQTTDSNNDSLIL